jgi:hypothetical protein
MHRIAWIALGCLGTAVMFSACSDGTGTTSSSTSTGSGSSSSSGSSTGGAGGSGVGGGGGTGGCTVDGQCAPSGPCKAVACVDGTCVEDLAPPGTPASTDVIGDCKRKECDASGNVAEIIDDTDKPQDYNACTIDSCSNGVPSNVPDASKEGLTCGGGQTKCMSGLCVGCNTDGHCPVGAICDKPVCDAQKVCGLVIDVGKIVTNPDPGDCFHEECDATGKIVTVAAPLENPPSDANECDNEVCSSNGVVHEPLPDGTTCGVSTECHPRGCMNAVCTDLPFPGNETIVSMQTLADCKVDVCDGAGGIVQINDDMDAPGDPNPADCTIVKCMNGSVGNGPAPAGTPCTQLNGLPGTCSATGVCS